MIHISQEELFRTIELENHDQNNNQGNHLASISETCAGDGGSEPKEVANSALERRRLSLSNCIEEGRQSVEEEATTVVGRRESAFSRPGRAMSSILPTSGQQRATTSSSNNLSNKAIRLYGNVAKTTTATTTTTTIKDKNNNNNNGEDEVQAVLITGCGSKIGSNIAVAFASRGLKVALVDFDIKQTESVAQECQDKSPKNRAPLQIVADISQLAEAHKVIDRTIEAFGRLDVLVNTVNNASLMEAKFNASGDDDPHVFEQYHKIIANNMHAVTYLCISAAPYLRKTKGSIVNVSSITNNETGSYKFAYCMSKAGISTLTKCLATDLAPDIKVICVSPKSDGA